ncbi:MAG: hypothetical protein ACE3JP_11900 [Ectobacillus sp.]
MKKVTVGIILVFLAFLASSYFRNEGPSLFGGKKTGITNRVNVSWEIENSKVTFVMKDSEGKQMRGLNDTFQNELRAVVVGETLEDYKEVQPDAKGAGTFTFPYEFSSKKTYTIFLYIDDGTSQEQFARTEVLAADKADEQQGTAKPALQLDPLLTTKTASYEMSFIFNTLKAQQQESLTFQFQARKDSSARFQFSPKKSSRLLIVDENRKHFFAVVPAEHEQEKRMQYTVIFPEEGLYKIWAVFYLNGKKYERPFVVRVTK